MVVVVVVVVEEEEEEEQVGVRVKRVRTMGCIN